MKTETEIGFVALLEAAFELEVAATCGPNLTPFRAPETESDIAARKLTDCLNALFELEGVDNEDCDIPWPEEIESPLINWLFGKAAEGGSTG